MINLIDVAAHYQVMNAPKGDINRASINQSPVISIDDGLDHFMLKVRFPAGVATHLQRTQKGRVKGAALATFNHPYGHPQFTKHRGQLPEIPPIASLAHLASTAPSSLRIAPLEVSPQSLSGLTGVDPCLAQPITDQIIIAHQDLLQNPKHQTVSKFLQPIDNLVEGHLTNCKFELKCYSNLSFHHGLFLLALVSQPQP